MGATWNPPPPPANPKPTACGLLGAGMLPPCIFLTVNQRRRSVAHPSGHRQGGPRCQQHPQASIKDIQLPIPGTWQVLQTWAVPSEPPCLPYGTEGLVACPPQPSSAWTAQGRTQMSALMPSAPSHPSAHGIFPGLTAISDLQISMCVLHAHTHLREAQTSH